MPKKYEMTIAGEKITIESKTHADVFRQFWKFFMETDIDKTVETIELAGIRTSDQEFFVAINGQKKKNILLVEGKWIYTHLSPKLMEKAYDKFVKFWEGEAQPEKPIFKDLVPSEIVETPEEPKKLTPREEAKAKAAAAAETQRLKREEKKRKAEERKAAKEAAKQQEITEADIESIEL